MKEAADRYNLPPVLGPRIRTYEVRSAPTPPFPPSRQSDASFLSMTIQMANEHTYRLVQWIQQEHRQHGAYPIIFVDEAHTSSDENSWGNTVRQLREAGAFTVLLTGTPYRADHQRIEGFKWIEGPTEPVKLFRARHDEDGDRYVDIYEGHRTVLRLDPESCYEFTLRDAWDVENPQPLCKMNRMPYDFDLSNYGEVTGEYRGSNTLSSLPPTQLLGGRLAALLRQDAVIETLCNGLVFHLRNRQNHYRDSAAIVFVGNDRRTAEGTDNWHARRVTEILETITREFKCVIATSAESSEGTKALRDFQRGHGDVLIVKQMGAVGYDVPRLKVAVDLSVVRSPAAFVQRVCRIARVCEVPNAPNQFVRTATYLTPDDILGAALWQNFISAQGGEAVHTEADYVDTRRVEATEGQEREVSVVDYVRPGDIYSDTNMQVSAVESLPLVERLVAEVPILEQFMTLPDVDHNMPGFKRAFGIEDRADAPPLPEPELPPPSEPTVIEDGNAAQKADQDEINQLARMVAEKRLGRRYSRETLTTER